MVETENCHLPAPSLVRVYVEPVSKRANPDSNQVTQGNPTTRARTRMGAGLVREAGLLRGGGFPQRLPQPLPHQVRLFPGLAQMLWALFVFKSISHVITDSFVQFLKIYNL